MTGSTGAIAMPPLGRVGTTCQVVVWTLSLVGLVIVLALVVGSERSPSEQSRE